LQQIPPWAPHMHLLSLIIGLFIAFTQFLILQSLHHMFVHVFNLHTSDVLVMMSWRSKPHLDRPPGAQGPLGAPVPERRSRKARKASAHDTSSAGWSPTFHNVLWTQSRVIQHVHRQGAHCACPINTLVPQEHSCSRARVHLQICKKQLQTSNYLWHTKHQTVQRVLATSWTHSALLKHFLRTSYYCNPFKARHPSTLQ
jgi:hypothetical protein